MIKKDIAISLGLGVLGAFLFTTLLVLDHVGATSYVLLLTLLSLVCLVIPAFQRLRELDLKNMKMTLDKMEEVRADVYAKEEDLRNASLILAKLITLNTTFLSIFGDENSNKYSRALILKQTEELLDYFNVSSSEKADIFKYQKALHNMRGLEGEAHDKAWQEIVKMLKHDCEQQHLKGIDRVAF